MVALGDSKPVGAGSLVQDAQDAMTKTAAARIVVRTRPLLPWS